MAATSWTIRALLSSCDLIMRIGVNEKLERKERNIVGLHEEEVDETAVEEHFAIVEVSPRWRMRLILVGFWMSLVYTMSVYLR